MANKRTTLLYCIYKRNLLKLTSFYIFFSLLYSCFSSYIFIFYFFCPLCIFYFLQFVLIFICINVMPIAIILTYPGWDLGPLKQRRVYFLFPYILQLYSDCWVVLKGNKKNQDNFPVRRHWLIFLRIRGKKNVFLYASMPLFKHVTVL